MPSFDVNWLLATLAQSSAALVAIVGGFLIARVIDLASRRDQLRARIKDIEYQIHSVTAQRSTTEDELASLRAPKEVRTGAWVLAYFSAVGVAAPVTVMMTAQTALDWWVRLLLVVGFLTGLGALMWFLFHVIRGVDRAGT